jgi:voltage-gated potassium channel
MYFMMTTLSTVGYGDYYPISSSEKIVGSFIQVIGVTLFATVMNVFIGIVLTFKDQDSNNDQENHLNRWFALIKSIRF